MFRDTLIMGEQEYKRGDWVLGKKEFGQNYDNMKDCYHIAMNPSMEWIKWAGVLMESIMMKTPQLKKSVCFHLLTDQIKEDDKAKLQKFADKWKVSVIAYFMNDNNVSKFGNFEKGKRNGKYVYAFYYRWLIPYVVDDSIEKILYLDVDTVCNKNILPILEETFEEPLLVVRDLEENLCVQRLRDIGCFTINLQHYFNTGFVHMNLNKVREKAVGEKIIQCLFNCVVNHIDLPIIEQDAANIALGGDVGYANILYHYPLDLGTKEAQAEKVQQEARDAYLVHFFRRVNPWLKQAQDFPTVKVWAEAKSQSEWRDAELVGEWDRLAYKTAARAALLNKNYWKWVKLKMHFLLLHFQKSTD